MATQQVNAAKLKSTGVNLTNLAAKMKSEMKCFVFKTISGRQSKSGPADPDLTADGSSSRRIFQQLHPGR